MPNVFDCTPEGNFKRCDTTGGAWINFACPPGTRCFPLLGLNSGIIQCNYNTSVYPPTGNCTGGSMMCTTDNTGFYMCANGLYQRIGCPPGTKCEQQGQYILCNFAHQPLGGNNSSQNGTNSTAIPTPPSLAVNSTGNQAARNATVASSLAVNLPVSAPSLFFL